MLATTAGIRLVAVTNDYRIMFSDDNPELMAFDALGQTYAVSDLVLIAVSPRQGSVFTQEALSAIEELTQAAWVAPYANRVDSLTNYQHSESFEDDLVVAPLVENAQSLSAADLARIEEIALNAIDIVGRLVAYDGATGGVAVTFQLPENHDAGVIEITDYLRETLHEARARYPELKFAVTGEVVMNRAFSDATKDEFRQLVPAVFLVIVVASIVLLRSIWGTIAIIAVLAFAVNSTMGLVGWAGVVISPTNSGIPIIVMVITIAHSVHVVSTTLSGIRRGMERNEAIAEAVRINFSPLVLTAVTTAIGFLSLNASDSPPFHVLGNFVALGALFSTLYALTLLPALLSILPLRPPRRSTPRLTFDRLAEFVIARRTMLLVTFGLTTIVLVAGVSRIELTDNFTKYFDHGYEFRRDSDYIIENLTGLESLEYSLLAERENGITDPEYLRKVEAFAEWFRQQPEVTYVQAFSDIMKRLNMNLNDDDPAFFRIPDSPELAAQYLLLYELSLPLGSDLNNRIDIAKSSTRLTAVVSDVSSKQQLDLDARAQEWIRANSPGLSDSASGISIIFANLSKRNIHGMLFGTIAAMTLVSLILVVVFRSIRLGLISLIPNFIPAAISFGTWGYLVGTVGMAASVVTAVAFGIIVDDTIHFLTEYTRSRRKGHSAADAVRSTFRTVSHALSTTTVVLAAGFLVFASSGFELSSTLGIMVAITICFALVADFLLLPPLLIAIDRRKA